jgi:hypothetical protein
MSGHSSNEAAAGPATAASKHAVLGSNWVRHGTIQCSCKGLQETRLTLQRLQQVVVDIARLLQ